MNPKYRVRQAVEALGPLAPDRLRMRAIRGGRLSAMALLDPDHAFLYVGVPKSASTTVRWFLWRMRGVDPAELPHGAAHKGCGPYADPARLRPDEARAVLRGDGTFRFTFVRNPYERLASAYRDKLVRQFHRPRGAAEHLGLLGFPADRLPSFDQFLDRVLSQPDIVSDHHWMSQHRLAMMDVISYHRIGKVETFAADFGAILARIGFPAEALERVEHRNLAAPEERQLVPCGYTQAQAERVHARYRRDFESFGYDAESYDRAS